jgi:hypothetical protein
MVMTEKSYDIENGKVDKNANHTLFCTVGKF